MAARFEGLTVHGAGNEIVVFHHNGQLRVVEPELRAVVDVAASTDGDTVVDDADFAMNIQLLLDEVLFLALQVASPLLLGDFPTVEHCCGSYRVSARDAVVSKTGFVAVRFELSLLIHHALFFFVAAVVAFVGGVLDAFAHDFLGLGALHILVFDARFLFLLHHCRGLVQAVIGAQVEEEDVVAGVYTFFLDLCENGFISSVNRFVLVVHDGACAGGSIIAQITGKTRNRRDQDDDAKFATFLAGSDAGVYDGAANEVVDGSLFFTSCGDEELILDVHVVLSIADDLAVGVLDTVFGKDAAAPIGAAAYDLRMHRARVLVCPRLGFYVR